MRLSVCVCVCVCMLCVHVLYRWLEREPGNHCMRMRQSYQQNPVSGLVEAG